MPASAPHLQPTPDWTPDQAWQAVSDRDSTFDGRLFYGVVTTGVFCKPSCGSRRPLRKNTQFFVDAGSAEASGFRPCRRCRPTSSRASVAEFCVRKAIAYLDERVKEKVTLKELGLHVGMSPYHLQRVFTRMVGVSPKAYQEARRSGLLREGLQSGSTVSEAIFSAGYGSVRGGYEAAGKSLGMTPGTYRRGGLGMTITWLTAPTEFGEMLVAQTEEGICAVRLGSDASSLLEALKSEYPAATFEQHDGVQGDVVQAVLDEAAGTATGKALPLDLKGTAFELRVWEALRAIPPGETRSYQDVAASLTPPSGPRAVARACSKNPVALLVPCHRVVRKDRRPSGYRWSLDRKQQILDAERARKKGS